MHRKLVHVQVKEKYAIRIQLKIVGGELHQLAKTYRHGSRAVKYMHNLLEKVLSMEISELCREANRKKKQELKETNISTTC